MSSKYKELGVDVEKRGIEAFKEAIGGLYPEAFCVIHRSPIHPDVGIILHTDSAGSKPIQAYLHWRETGDPSWFGGLAQDVLAMNLDDVVCVGARPLAFVDYIAFNTLLIDREALLKETARGFDEVFARLRRLGLNILFAGGETADLPDQLRTLDISGTILAQVSLKEVITGDAISPGDLIVGLRSGGKANYEERMNSGIMCNGLTLARSSLMTADYLKKYPELVHPVGRRYKGRFRFDDYLEELDMTLGEALLSPTRIYAPIILSVLREVGDGVHGLVHNTGGGLTKCLRLGRDILYLKDTLPEPDAIFRVIQREGEVDWREMYTVFNMGVGFEVIVDPQVVEEVVDISERYGVEATVIGRCERSPRGNRLRVESRYGRFLYP
jgi:phosphoribosylformylglycinamidine cyclo-ligase